MTITQTGFYGRFDFGLDLKKCRFSVPAEFRAAHRSIDQKADEDYYLFVTMGSKEGSLFVFPESNWPDFTQKIREMDVDPETYEALRLRFISKAHKCSIDKQGRVAIPSHLINDAGIGSEVTIVGDVERFLIWDRKVLADKEKGAEAKVKEALNKFRI